MRITREADYSIRILIRLAMAKERMGASEIAADTSISQRFALKILNKLCHAGLVISFKGIRGGYCLNKPAEDITLLDVITLIDGEIAEPEMQSDELQDEIPDWLLRIRQRTSEEPDSVGEITQKIQAAQESLVEDERADRQDHFSSWLEKLGDDPESAPEVAPIEKPVIDDSEELQPDGEPGAVETVNLR